MKIIIASKNPGKYQEIQDFLTPVSGLTTLAIPDSHSAIEVEETGETYQDNSFLKAKAFYIPAVDYTLADDAGIEIPVISKQLGVKTRRFGAGEKVSDQEWLDYFLNYFKNYKGDQRQARFKTSLCLYNGQTPLFFEGIVTGRIAQQQQCPIIKGIPLSSVFIPDGFSVAMSQMPLQQKNQISHRAKALTKLLDFLNQTT